MARPLLPDSLWKRVEPLLPPPRPRPKGGRPPVPHRAALTGILFVLKTGIQWNALPREMGCGSGVSCWRRLRDWHQAGVWERLHHVLLEELEGAHLLDWSRASLDSLRVPAKKKATTRGPTRPTGARQAARFTFSSTAKGFHFAHPT